MSKTTSSGDFRNESNIPRSTQDLELVQMSATQCASSLREAAKHFPELVELAKDDFVRIPAGSDGTEYVAIPANIYFNASTVLSTLWKHIKTELEGDPAPAQVDIKTARELRGLKQNELAKRAGVPQSIISRLETDPQAGCNIKSLVKLARALDMPLFSLLK